MEISGIRSAFPFMFQNGEKDGEAAKGLQAIGDIVDLHAPELLADEDVDDVLAETMGMITQDNVAALSVHSLSEQRVFSLLGI